MSSDIPVSWIIHQGMGLLPTLQRRMSTLSRQDSKGNAAKSEDRLSLQHNSYLKKSYFTGIFDQEILNHGGFGCSTATEVILALDLAQNVIFLDRVVETIETPALVRATLSF